MDTLHKSVHSIIGSVLHSLLRHTKTVARCYELSLIWWRCRLQVWISTLWATTSTSCAVSASSSAALSLVDTFRDSALVVSQPIDFNLLLHTDLKRALTAWLCGQIKLHLLGATSLWHAMLWCNRLTWMRLMGPNAVFTTITDHVVVYWAFHLPDCDTSGLKCWEADVLIFG